MATLIEVSDPADPRLADYRDLRDVELRKHLEAEHGLFLAEGEKVVRRAVEGGFAPRSFLMAPRWLEGLAGILDRSEAPCYVVSEALAEEVTGFHVHRGALASLERRTLPPVEDVLASGRRGAGRSRLAVLEGLVDHGNVGSVFRNAAAAVYGMCAFAGGLPRSERPSVGMTMLGQTTPGAMVIAERLESAGYEPIIFHANGIGGPAMDSFATDGLLAGVIDLTLSEPANSIFDGIHATSPERMRAAVRAGLPLVVVPGAADFFNQGPLDSVPERWRDRPSYKHNPVATLVRVQRAEMVRLAHDIAERVNPATAPTAVIVPTRGLSLIGIPGGPIEDRDADEALAAELGRALAPHIRYEVVEDAVNSAAFANHVADVFLELLSASRAARDAPAVAG